MFCPLIYIIDKQDKPKKVDKKGNLLALLDPSPDLNNFYFRKYRPDYVWYGEQFEEQCAVFAESYFDGKAKINFRSDERKHENTKVIEVSSAEFPEKVLKISGKCVLEIFKNDCDACHYNARMFDIFSNKMSKHGYLA